MEYRIEMPSPVGQLTLASDGKYLTGLWIEGQEHYGSTMAANADPTSVPVFEETKLWLERYFEGKDPGALPPLKPQGTEFRQLVWKELVEIPWGSVTTYGTIAGTVAQRLGKQRMSAQAVGGAVANNPISILIPCHRVISSTGELVGYAGGVHIKEALLKLEGVIDRAASLPKR